MDPDELAQALRDEREQRLVAERRIADLQDHVEVWRTRAEERATRIEQLRARAEVPWLRRAARTVRRGLTQGGRDGVPDGVGTGDPRSGNDPPAGPVAPAAPLHPEVACVAITGDDELAPVLAELRTTDRVDDRTLAAADLVVVDAAGPDRLDPDARAALRRWLDAAGRAPLVQVGPGAGGSLPELTGATVRVRTGELPSFDARRHHPGSPPLAVTALDDRAAALLDGQGTPDADLLEELWTAAPRWFLELAGRGLAGWRPDADPTRGAAAAARVAARRHASWVAVDELLARAGVPARGRDDRVAAVLVSNRPERVVAAVERVARFRGVPVELVVGLHGIAPPAGLSAALDGADGAVDVVDVHELDGDLSLGACLNRCIEDTSAPFVAKIDDDDHYGPRHLEDGVRALRATGADLVGKGAQFTYVEAVDRTVLRRPRTEETFLDGTPTGASWVLRRALWQQVAFPHRPRRVDALFLEGARAVGAQVYAGGRWEFCYVRSDSDHTWRAADETFLAGVEPGWEGHDPARCELDEPALLPGAALAPRPTSAPSA